MLIIFTSEQDAHADFIIKELNIIGYSFFRINPKTLPIQSKSTIEFSNRSQIGYLDDFFGDRKVDFQKIRSIWWRRPDPFEIDINHEEKDFAEIEWSDYFRGILDSFPFYWMSHPAMIRQASLKIEQLSRAKALGFDIPNTLITTSRDVILDFFYTNKKEIVFKVLTDPFLNPKANFVEKSEIKVVKTTLVTQEMLDLHLQEPICVPCQFQELVEKKYELRVTVIGNKVFACKISSQENEKTKLDWRDYTVSIPYEAIELPIEFERKCIEFVKSYNLNYSALDFIVTPDNRYVFLENNPNGQFLFVEHLVPEIKMKDHLIRCLIASSSDV